MRMRQFDFGGRPARSARSDRIVIIGGGIAGLACGCYLQMNGFETEILEAGTALGGLCAAWNRGPYTFDGCLRWLLGTQPSLPFHRIWSELGVTSRQSFLSYEEITRIEGREGEVLSVPADLDKLRQEFKRVAPEDAALIDQLVRAARRSAPLKPLEQPVELLTPLKKLKTSLSYLPMLPVFARWKGVPVSAYLARYQNPLLREALMALAGDARVSALVLVMLLAFRCGRNTGFLVGGSRALAQTLTERYTRLGGRVQLNARVACVVVENGRAAGVRCTDQNLVPATAVVSCADGHTTIFQMLGVSYLDKHDAEKQRVLQEVTAILEGRFPGLARHVEATDVAAPANFVRWTGNWQGSSQGWLPTPRILGGPFQFVLLGLKDFYMAGHWVVTGGGLRSAALAGRYVAQLICARNSKGFVATVAQP